MSLFEPKVSPKPVAFLRLCFSMLSVMVCPYLCAAEAGQSKNPQEIINNTRELRALMQSDPHRPIYHFLAPEGHAMPFDPNGAIYWKGKYHLGYVYQKFTEADTPPHGKRQFVWGHAVSTDLLHWTMYPDMLDIQEGDLEKHIYSGGIFLSREGVPHIIYHSSAGNMLASSMDDDLKVWKKFSGNPVLKALDSKDPWALKKGEYSVFDAEAWYDTNTDSYYQVTGGIKPGLFKSKDMHRWEYLGNAISGPDTMRYPFEDVSCPKFFSLGEKFMHLSISHALGTHYYIGTFANDKFTPEHHGRMNWPGGTFFAPDHLQDAKGRNIIWGWIVQTRSSELQREFDWSPTIQPSELRDYGWYGVMSLPRVVSLSRKGTLQINPPEEMQAIRLNEVREDDVVLQPNTETTLQARGKSIELKLEIAGGTQTPFGVKVFASPDGREETVIRYEPERDQLVIDFVRSSVRGPVSLPFFLHNPERTFGSSFNRATYDYSEELSRPLSDMVSDQRAPLHLEKGETLQLDIFLDRSIIEVFANGRQVVTQVVYPELEASIGVKVFSGKEAVTVKQIQSWTIAETNAY